MSIAQAEIADEHDLYPCHEEDTVPEIPAHEVQTRYLRDALSASLPQHWVTGEICMYWVRGDTARYVAPDVLVLEGPQETHPYNVYLAWSDALPLMVIEVGSRSTLVKDQGPKVERYFHDLNVQEYLYFDRVHSRIRMWRRENVGSVEAVASPNGQFVSHTLDREFGTDAEGFLRVYERNGCMLLTHVEMAELAQQEHQRVELLERELERLREELRRMGSGAPAQDQE